MSIDGIEYKFNPNHDPKDGRFTFGDGAGNARVVDAGTDNEKTDDKSTYTKVMMNPEEYNQQAPSLWKEMAGDPETGFRNDTESTAAAGKVQTAAPRSNADVESPADVRSAVSAIADSTRNAKLQGNQNFEKTVTFERSADGHVIISSLGVAGSQGGKVSGITRDTVAVAHVHYAGLGQSPFKGDNSPVLVRDLSSFVIEGETGRVWEVGRQNGRYVQRTLGKGNSVGRWQAFGQ